MLNSRRRTAAAARDDRFTGARRFNMDASRIRRWAAKHLGKTGHECRVARLACTLFNMTRPLHGLSLRRRRLLRWAALVHDVGRCRSKQDHPRRGAELILDDHSLRVGSRTRRELAFLTLYHRDKIPMIGQEEILLETDDRQGLRILLAILRVADALDSRSRETPRLEMGLRKRRLKVRCYLESCGPKTRRVYERRRKFRLLEEELGCRVNLRVRRLKQAA